MVLKDVPSDRTRVASEQVKELQQEKAIGLEAQKSCFANGTATEDFSRQSCSEATADLGV